MSTSMSVHFGPWIQVHSKVKLEVLDSCPNKEECPSEKEVNFCSKCGKSSSERMQTHDSSPNMWKVFEENDIVDELFFFASEKNGSIDYKLFANSMSAPGTSIDKYGGEQAIDYTPEMLVSDVSRFKEMYAEHLNILENAYGKDNVVVRCGLVNYWL